MQLFENFYKLRKIYREVLGINNIDHCAICIESPDGYLSSLSYNPGILLTQVANNILPYEFIS